MDALILSRPVYIVVNAYDGEPSTDGGLYQSVEEAADWVAEYYRPTRYGREFPKRSCVKLIDGDTIQDVTLAVHDIIRKREEKAA